MNNRVFLGGTWNGSAWREHLKQLVQVELFDPIVDDWTPECRAIEMDEKANKCNVHLYVITSKMTGVFSIAEVVDSVHTCGKRTILHVIPDGFDATQLLSLKAVVDLVNLRGGVAYIDSDLNRTAGVLNHCFS